MTKSFTLLSLLLLAGCGSGEVTTATRHYAATERCCAGYGYMTKATAYHPTDDSVEGGHNDRKGKRVRTLQDFIDGHAEYVSIAMDSKILPYGAKVCIPELNDEYNRAIPFRVVDTGGAFKNRGFSRIDVCVRTEKDAYAKSVNKKLELIVCD